MATLQTAVREPQQEMKMWIAVDSALPPAQVLTLCAEAASGLAALIPESFDQEPHLIDYEDANGKIYPCIMWHGIIIFSGKQAALNKFLTASFSLAWPALVRQHGDDRLKQPEQGCKKAHDAVAVFGIAGSDVMKKASNKLSLYNPKLSADEWPLQCIDIQASEFLNKDVLVLSRDMAPGRAANVCAHLGVAAHERARALSVNAEAWHPHVVVCSDERQHELLNVFDASQALRKPCVAFLKTMEVGGAKVQIEETRSTCSADVYFDAVAVVGSREICICCEGSGEVSDEVCPLCDGDPTWLCQTTSSMPISVPSLPAQAAPPVSHRQDDAQHSREKMPEAPTRLTTMYLQFESTVGDDVQDLQFCKTIEAANGDGLKELWDVAVKQDPHCAYRERAYGTFDVRVDTNFCTVSRKKTSAFCQGSTNSLVQQGKIPQVRWFADLPSRFESSIAVQDIFMKTVSAVADFEQKKGRSLSGGEIGVHMFRVHCSRDVSNSPAPEGRHQDGFPYISVSCLNRCNVKGGESIVALTRDGPPVLETTLLPRQGMVFDDQAYYHDVTAILPSDGFIEGHRDVLVLTFTPE